MNPFALGPLAIACYNRARSFDLHVEGSENVPRRGPALLAARHYHHLFDGAALLTGFARKPAIFVALDWTRSRSQRLVMERLCRLADWPVALRAESVATNDGAYAASEVRRYLRAARERTISLLRRGELVAIFPEGYPTIDPAGSRKGDATFLPFRAGIVRLALAAAKASGAEVPIVPIGFSYALGKSGRYAVTMRAGERLATHADTRARSLIADLEGRVRALSAP